MLQRIQKGKEEGIDPVTGKRIFPLPDESNFKSDVEFEEFEGGIFWKSFHRKIFNCKDFDELSQLIDETNSKNMSTKENENGATRPGRSNCQISAASRH